MNAKNEKTALFFGIDINTVKLLRIPFSYFLMPVFFFALSQVKEIDWRKAIICFFVLLANRIPGNTPKNVEMTEIKVSNFKRSRSSSIQIQNDLTNKHNTNNPNNSNSRMKRLSSSSIILTANSNPNNKQQ